MKGWLIYTKEGAKRNAWFISRLQQEAKTQGLCLQLQTAQTAEELPKDTLPDFAIVRAMNADVNAYLESRGVRTFNNAQTARVAGDKWQTYTLCKRLQIPVLSTVLAKDNLDNQTYPAVVKSRFGHGGSEVFWAENVKQASKCADKPSDYILQTPSQTLGKDMRLYVIGGKIVAAVLRTSRADFRSNFSLGGSVTLAQADETQKRIVHILQEHLQTDFVGIDFLPDGEGWVLNEIEDAAGARMLYSCSDVDVVALFIKHIKNSLYNQPL